MLRTLGGLITELRAVGIPISPTEHIDAAEALRHTSIEDRSAVRAALGATLVKHADHWNAFATVFDLYFAERRGDLSPSSSSSSPEFTVDSPPGGGVFGGMGDGDLGEVLYRAIRDRDRMLMRALAGQVVTRYAGMEPGRRVAGVFYLSKAMRALNLPAVLARLAGEQEAASTLDRQLAAQEHELAAEDFRREVEQEIRERLVADRGPEDVARTLRRPLPEDLDFLNATATDAVAIKAALKPLARKLAARLARKRRSQHDSTLDFRATMRRSLSTGGTPVELVFRKPHPSRPELVILADISGSVATFASFTLHLVYALRSEFARVRTFVFIDGIDEVTETMEQAENVVEMTHRINQGPSAARLYGGSDYGNALRLFESRWGDQVRNTSTVIVLGDARNNYLPPRDENLAAVAGRARSVFWLNPEPLSSWNTGDSIVGRYAPHCTGVYECRNIRQLKQFVEQLD